MKKILVTSALPYANGPIHIGHLVEYIQTDIHVRYLKATGKDAIYCCADDTHGAPISINAQKQGMTPEEFIAKWHEEHTEAFDAYHVKFDSYYTTNSPENKHYTELIFSKLKDKGHIYQKEIELTYCENCKRFLPDRYVKGTCPKCGAKDQYGDVCEKCNASYTTIDLVEPYCSICGKTPVRKLSPHYFFKLSDFSQQLRLWLTSNKELQPEIVNQILTWIDEGLQDWCISRDGPYFGFKIPGEEEKYFYVWLDAPIGYIASTANYCKGKDCTADDIWQGEDSRIVHFIGKDIIYFHLLFWPAVLMAAGFHVPDAVIVHGFLTVNGEKMSKSRGTFLSAKEFLDYADPELLRYYYASNLTKTMTDIDLDLKNFEDRVNNDLVSNIANFAYRTLSFTEKNFEGKIGKTKDHDLLAKVHSLAEKAGSEYQALNYREALRAIFEIGALGNRHFQENAPWELVKKDRQATLDVLTDCVNIIKTIAITLKPIMPVFSESIEKQLGVEALNWEDLSRLLEDHQLGKSEIILRKIEPIKLKEPEKPVVKDIDPFSKLDLRVAKITDVKKHPKADKLYIEQVDLGKETRQIVSGLVPYYKPEELLGKNVVIVANLEPAVLRGERSEGMLLAGEEGDIVGVLVAPQSKPGDQVTVDGITPGNDKIPYAEFSKAEMTVAGGIATYKGKPLQTTTEKIAAEKVKEGIVR